MLHIDAGGGGKTPEGWEWAKQALMCSKGSGSCRERRSRGRQQVCWSGPRTEGRGLEGLADVVVPGQRGEAEGLADGLDHAECERAQGFWLEPASSQSVVNLYKLRKRGARERNRF